MVMFPTTADIGKQFPHIDPSIIRDDLAFPAMMSFLPTGLLGLIVAALIAAFMSTISTHLNWGSSYIINDFYGRFVDKNAGDKKLVNLGRLSTLVLMVLAALVALYLDSALDSFNILLQIGAGTGLIFILRWFWYRINAWSEISGMLISFAVAFYFQFMYKGEMASYEKLIIGVLITTIGWIFVTLITKPESDEVLQKFYSRVQPHNAGWRGWLKKIGKPELAHQNPSNLGLEISAMILGCVMVYGFLFGLGYWIYGDVIKAFIFFGAGIASGLFLWKMWPRLSFS
jgi:solute:Na+ symporter, SSS family